MRGALLETAVDGQFNTTGGDFHHAKSLHGKTRRYPVSDRS